MNADARIAGAADVVVVGGGPAGLMASIAAARLGRRVVVVERLRRPGRKLLASGGGRCNLATALPEAEILAAFGRRGRFVQPALAALSGSALRAMLHARGVPTHAPDGRRVFPVSDRAADVLGALLDMAEEGGVRLRAGVGASALWMEGGRLAGIDTSAGRLAATRVILAAGGMGYPDLGGSGAGYDLARQAGHTLADPRPALVPLVTREIWPRRCAGIALSAAQLRIDLAKQPKAGVSGGVLFTHRGISGPAVLDLSGDVSVLLARHETVPVVLDLDPATPRDAWLARFGEWERVAGRRSVRTLLAGYLSRSLAEVVLALAEVDPHRRPSQVAAPLRRRLADRLTRLPLTVTGTEGWARAMVTRGGVALGEVDPQTLESRRLPGLAFAGEILDLDGPTGGFNLQWAFASGFLAGRAAT